MGVNFDTSFKNPLLKFNFIHYGVSPGTRIAYDGLSDNLYWADPIYKKIGVQPAANDNTLNHMYRFIVDTDLSRPEGIAVDSVRRYRIFTRGFKIQTFFIHLKMNSFFFFLKSSYLSRKQNENDGNFNHSVLAVCGILKP